MSTRGRDGIVVGYVVLLAVAAVALAAGLPGPDLGDTALWVLGSLTLLVAAAEFLQALNRAAGAGQRQGGELARVAARWLRI